MVIAIFINEEQEERANLSLVESIMKILSRSHALPPTRLLFEDKHLLAVNKPAGMLSQSSRTESESMVSIVQAHLSRSTTKNVHLIHRLDRNTSGVLLFAKHELAAKRMSFAMRSREIRKHYLLLAQCHGHELKGAGSLKSLIQYEPNKKNVGTIITDLDENPMSALAVKELRLRSQKDLHAAELEYEVLQSLPNNHHLVYVNLLTGKKHQIRIQMQALQCTIVGDNKYKASEIEYSGSSKGGLGHRELGLCAVAVEFMHPFTNELLFISAPPSEKWQTFDKGLMKIVDKHMARLRQGKG